MPSFPRRSELEHTRVLDVRGTLRYEVLAALPPMPKLDTLRMYEYYNAAPGSTEAGKTLFWGASQREPSLPVARRLVVFSSLAQCPHGKFKPQLPRHYPPGVEELVIHLVLPCGRESGDWAPLDIPPQPPTSLSRVIVILAPSPCSSPACGASQSSVNAASTSTDHSHDAAAGAMLESRPGPAESESRNESEVTRAHEPGTDTDVDPHTPDPTSVRAMVEDLVAVLKRLAVPATIVGGECLGKQILTDGGLAPLERAGAELKSTAEVSAALGDREWSTMNREAQRL